jgi:hypothetical protein
VFHSRRRRSSILVAVLAAALSLGAATSGPAPSSDTHGSTSNEAASRGPLWTVFKAI